MFALKFSELINNCVVITTHVCVSPGNHTIQFVYFTYILAVAMRRESCTSLAFDSTVSPATAITMFWTKISFVQSSQNLKTNTERMANEYCSKLSKWWNWRVVGLLIGWTFFVPLMTMFVHSSIALLLYLFRLNYDLVPENIIYSKYLIQPI